MEAAVAKGRPILVVEDEARIASAIARVLEANGFEATTTGSGLGGLRRLATASYELVILDLLLPDLDGFSVLHSVKERMPDQQVLVLSAIADTQSKVRCLELGACDYVSKPFDFAELLARIRVRLGDGNGAARYLRSESFTLDLHRRLVVHNGQEISLASREFVLLEYLMRKKGEVATREELLEQVWHYAFDPKTNVVDVCVARLRHKLDGAHIETVRNVGYCFLDS